MDSNRFDELAKSLIGSGSRRRALGGLLGGTFALVGRLADDEARAYTCKKAGQYCDDQACCRGTVCVGFSPGAICLGGGDCVLAFLDALVGEIPIYKQIQLGIDLFGRVYDLVSQGRYEEAYNEAMAISIKYGAPPLPYDCFPVRSAG